MLTGYLCGCELKSCSVGALSPCVTCSHDKQEAGKIYKEKKKGGSEGACLAFCDTADLVCKRAVRRVICICISVPLSPSFLCVSSFVTFCCAVTFSAVRPLPDLSLSDSLLMTEPSSLGNLLQVTIATGEAVSSSGSWAHSQIMSSFALTTSPFSFTTLSSCPLNITDYN